MHHYLLSLSCNCIIILNCVLYTEWEFGYWERGQCFYWQHFAPNTCNTIAPIQYDGNHGYAYIQYASAGSINWGSKCYAQRRQETQGNSGWGDMPKAITTETERGRRSSIVVLRRFQKFEGIGLYPLTFICWFLFVYYNTMFDFYFLPLQLAHWRSFGQSGMRVL